MSHLEMELYGAAASNDVAKAVKLLADGVQVNCRPSKVHAQKKSKSKSKRKEKQKKGKERKRTKEQKKEKRETGRKVKKKDQMVNPFFPPLFSPA